MSAFSRNSNNNNNAKKPFCKVCADAGKTDTAHYVRATPDPNSAVVCPTLKALECRYCYKNGHTVKYCPVLKKNNKDKDKFDRQQRRVTAPIVAPVATVAPVKTGKFALLEDDDDDDIELTTTTIDNLPSISTTTSVTPVVTWASMAAAVAHIPQPKPKITAITPVIQQNDDDESVDDEYDDDKIAIGDQLYYRIIDNYPSHAADVVGMLLDLDEHQLSILLLDEHELNRRVVHCIQILQPTYQQQLAVDDDDW
uniref:Nanos-type domain-containing protein n=1 Tax=viral metagenome TaxID=1070528 RepID=A0A6C0I7S6_9ZZZZ